MRLIDIEQGSEAWKELRFNKITSTDVGSIFGVNPYCTKRALYFQKLKIAPAIEETRAMIEGKRLEPIARKYFEEKTGLLFEPTIEIHDEYDFMMASTDGVTKDRKYLLEIKCGKKSHALALKLQIPKYYEMQVMHALFVCDIQQGFYFSFDGKDGIIIEVKRDDEFIKDMIIKEKEFYRCMMEFEEPI